MNQEDIAEDIVRLRALVLGSLNKQLILTLIECAALAFVAGYILASYVSPRIPGVGDGGTRGA